MAVAGHFGGYMSSFFKSQIMVLGSYAFIPQLLLLRTLLSSYPSTKLLQHHHDGAAWKTQAFLSFSLQDVYHTLKYYVKFTGRQPPSPP